LARTFQTPADALGLTPIASVLAACPGALDDATAEAVARACLKRAGVSIVGASDTLSPTQTRGLDLARALATGPSILLLDVPTAGLSPVERDDLARCLKALAEDGLGLLIVDHTMDFLLPLADRVVCLAAGSVVAEGTPEHVSRSPAAIAAYFGGAPT
jgi:branched-chain amino acid transport system permease protein